jgi:hypothetical protein
MSASRSTPATCRGLTREEFDRAPARDGGMFFQHPLPGRDDVPGLLRFMSAHEQRHQSQFAAVISGA